MIHWFSAHVFRVHHLFWNEIGINAKPQSIGVLNLDEQINFTVLKLEHQTVVHNLYSNNVIFVLCHKRHIYIAKFSDFQNHCLRKKSSTTYIHMECVR